MNKEDFNWTDKEVEEEINNLLEYTSANTFFNNWKKVTEKHNISPWNGNNRKYFSCSLCGERPKVLV